MKITKQTLAQIALAIIGTTLTVFGITTLWPFLVPGMAIVGVTTYCIVATAKLTTITKVNH